MQQHQRCEATAAECKLSFVPAATVCPSWSVPRRLSLRIIQTRRRRRRERARILTATRAAPPRGGNNPQQRVKITLVRKVFDELGPKKVGPVSSVISAAILATYQKFIKAQLEICE